MKELEFKFKYSNFSKFHNSKGIFPFNPITLVSLSLFENDSRLSIPIVGYMGGYYTYITFAAAFGIPKRAPTSNLGPYYYFGDYYTAGRWAIWSYTRKEKNVNDEIITVNEYGVYKQGGIARYAFFGDKMKYFLNRKDDVEDDSKISQDLAKDNEFYRERLKLRDVAGKWANDHDIAYISSPPRFVIPQVEYRFYIQFAIRDFYQQIPLSYHYVNTSEFSDIKGDNEQKEMLYNYKNYNIA